MTAVLYLWVIWICLEWQWVKILRFTQAKNVIISDWHREHSLKSYTSLNCQECLIIHRKIKAFIMTELFYQCDAKNWAPKQFSSSHFTCAPCFPDHSSGTRGWDTPWSLLQNPDMLSSSWAGESCAGFFWFSPPLSDTCGRFTPIFDSVLHFCCLPG